MTVGRRQHDADLERRRGDLVVVVLGERGVALLLLLDGAARQLARCPRPCRRRPPARSGSARRSWPIRRSACAAPPCAPRRSPPASVDLRLLARHDGRRAADVLGLEEIPEVRRLDLEVQRRGLRALAERFGERQEQRDHRDQQRDLLVVRAAMRGMLRVLVMLEIFVRPMLIRRAPMVPISGRCAEPWRAAWGLCHSAVPSVCAGLCQVR